MATNKPANVSSKIWASLGDVEAPTDAKMETGWVAEVPKAQVENWVQNRQDAFNAHVNERGIAEWDASTDYIANKSYVQDSSGTVYRAVQNTGPSTIVQNPTTDGTNTYWAVAFTVGSLDVYTKGQSDVRFVKNSELPDASTIPGRLTALEQFNGALSNDDEPDEGAALLGFSRSVAYLGGVGAALNELYSGFGGFLFSDTYPVDASGALDSTAGIQELFAEAKERGAVAVIRPGTYKVTGQCNYSGLTVLAHGATFNIDHSAANPAVDVTGFRALASDSHWGGGLFDIVGTSYTQATAAQINGTRQGAFWIGEYYKAGPLTRIERVSLKHMRFKCSGGFHGCNQVQFTGNLAQVELDQLYGSADGRAGAMIAFEWGRDTSAGKTYHPEGITIGTIAGTGYRVKFNGCVLFMSGVCDVHGGYVSGINCAQTVRIVAGDYGETAAMPEYAGRILRGLSFDGISAANMQWRALHVSGRGDAGNLLADVSVKHLTVSGNGAAVSGGYFEALSAGFSGGETGNYGATGMKGIYNAFGNLRVESLTIQNFGGYGYFQGSSTDADCSVNSYGACSIGALSAQNLGGPAFYVSAATASFEVLRIDQINAQTCAANTGAFTGNLAAFAGYGVDDADLSRVVDVSIGSGRIGAIGGGASFGIRSPGGAVRANYAALRVGDGTNLVTAVSHGSSGSADRVTHVGCDFDGASTDYGGKAAVGALS